MLVVLLAVLAALALGAVAAVTLLGDAPEESELVTDERKVSALELRVGDCFDKPSGDALLNVHRVPCTDAHDAQVLFPVPFGDATFPGEQAAFDTVLKKCWEHLMGRAIGDEFETLLFTPTASSWEQGRRNGTCAVVRSDGAKLTGPVGAR